TRSPALCRDDGGLVWMVYLSKRPIYDIYSSAPYFLYRTSTSDGRNWSRPKPIRPTRPIQYQEVPCLTRGQRDDFRLFLGDSMVAAPSPDQFGPMRPLYIPVREDWAPQDSAAVFDGQGRCHLVYVDSKGKLYYSYADANGIWRVNTRLVDVESASVDTPQLIVDGDRLALLYWLANGLWLRCGRLSDEGPRFGPAKQITTHRIDGQGARVMRDQDHVYLPIAARPPLLLRASLNDLLRAD
ncbi:MAG: hypothetical protein JJ992_06360, partial [Planctomycetes bacterium]|nr:hypothetical protein [Planctomycetota bacterium]